VIYIVRKPIYIFLQGVKILMAKFSNYIGKVNAPCKKCNSMVKVGIFEKMDTCPNCHAKWAG